jgi:hypothetical protein
MMNKQHKASTITIDSNREDTTSILEDLMKLPISSSSDSDDRVVPAISTMDGDDILVALHACDTATDDVIFCGIQHNAKVIVVSPCCHKEVRRFIDSHMGGRRMSLNSRAIMNNNSNNNNNNSEIEKKANKCSSIGPLIHVMKYGIYRERQAEMVTDTIRAMVLDYMGYDTNVFEFINY